MRLARMETDANLRAWIRLAAILGTIPVLAVVTFFLGLDALVKMIAALTGLPSCPPSLWPPRSSP